MRRVKCYACAARHSNKRPKKGVNLKISFYDRFPREAYKVKSLLTVNETSKSKKTASTVGELEAKLSARKSHFNFERWKGQYLLLL
ncbi:unnamed protein product [Lactuca saligna]|uniref:Uncharacterized protein n=1 Tax=Lactuca saligna TaxID=75948 RepID=A0AA35Z9I6_LACSI|nr:unnamed protein product [Lactuca saligna]